ncbi:hypothetical protein NDU88_001985 [Pleurodeles waltl]|uniref:Uncharacterized protein n=1 Tax=Pleurodeles waltl TaxID=8319 RepID=A0AAV7KRN6_PLEWA|nr:hypothetical protein NDU88_001985 [Pleurodeles waltl]
MQGDYTATQQMYLNSGTGDNPSSNLMSGPPDHVEPPSLELIYRTMVHNHKQVQMDNSKGKLANKQLQTSIKRVVESCQDISAQITTMETRTDRLETEVQTVVKQAAMQELQFSDIQWKLEEAENRQRRNNLRIL